jgi:general secretion pathway protein D
MVNFVDVGVSLKVTPIINQDGFVIMKIRPEVSRVDHTLTDTAGDVIPIVNTTNAETSVMVKDGYTIIIGGMISSNNTRTTNKFPGLGDLPLIGNAFRQVSESVVKTEMVVFLTPHIIQADKDKTQWDNKQIKPIRGYDDNA